MNQWILNMIGNLKKNKNKKGYELDKELDLMLASSDETRRVGVMLMVVLILVFIAVVIL